ncbi:Plasmodium vivax Vir protein, putative [Plasmodium vivax]|nr:Plasmodium vivax Vir protein, putative [Plasmodium vivax]
MAVDMKDFTNFPNNIVSQDIQNRNDIIKTCIRLKNYLLHFKDNNLCDDNKCCGYFNFWLNEKARGDDSINEITFSHYKNCTKYYSNAIENNKCISEIYYIENYEFAKKQELYYLYDIYDAFNLIIGDHSKCSFSNMGAHKYNAIIGKCKNVIDDSFCDELINFGNNFLKKILTSNEQCEEEIVELLSPENAIAKPEEKVEQQQEQQEKHQESPPSLPQDQEETEKSAHGGVRLENVASVETQVGAVESSVMICFTSNNANKFTPLGNWVNTKILGRNKLMDNMRKNEREFLLNSALTRDINSGDMIYRIKYNSV